LAGRKRPAYRVLGVLWAGTSEVEPQDIVDTFGILFSSVRRYRLPEETTVPAGNRAEIVVRSFRVSSRITAAEKAEARGST